MRRDVDDKAYLFYSRQRIGVRLVFEQNDERIPMARQKFKCLYILVKICFTLTTWLSVPVSQRTRGRSPETLA